MVLMQSLAKRRPSLIATSIMTTPVKTVQGKASVLKTEQYMTRLGVNVLPVVNSKNRYLGLISRETIQKALFYNFSKFPVHTFMQTDVYTATPQTPFHNIHTHMIERNQRFVPVVKNNQVIGTFTRTDLLRTLLHYNLETTNVTTKDLPNVKHLLKGRLPRTLYNLLIQVGKQGEEYQVRIFLVGGFVRDLLLGISNLDIDLVVEGNSMALAKIFAKRQEGRVRTHDRFGTATVICSNTQKLDFATARTEYYEFPAALPTVEQSSIKKDLYRRDFTINTLAICLNHPKFGELIDFYGGQRDLHGKTIRVLHSLSFIEDPTRVFRAIRFAQRLNFRLGKETTTLIKSAISMGAFQRLSKSRLLNETILLLSAETPRKILQQLAEFDLLKLIHQKLQWSLTLAHTLKASEKALKWYTSLHLDQPMNSWVVYWMVLMDTLPNKAIQDTHQRLQFPQQQAKKIRLIGRRTSSVIRQLSKHRKQKPSDIHRMLCEFPDEALVFLMAKAPSETIKRHLSAFLTTYRHIHPTLNGTDLKRMGLKPGPQFRGILDKLLDGRLNGEVKTESDERNMIKQLIKTT